MSKFVMAGEDEILNGDVTDVYFDYTKEYLKKLDKNPCASAGIAP